jgi:hypothetical protein
MRKARDLFLRTGKSRRSQKNEQLGKNMSHDIAVVESAGSDISDQESARVTNKV